MKSLLLLNANIVNEGHISQKDLLIENGIIAQIGSDLSSHKADQVLDLKGKYLLPGVIDDQVHFREPGLTHKGNIESESRAAVAGGITSFMEMPNTVPNALTIPLMEDKYQIAFKTSLSNYSFFMGGSNDNMEELLKVNPKTVCGIKVFMGSSTGNMLVDNAQTLENIFKNSPMLVATHCEDEETIKRNSELYKQKYGDDISADYHAEIRSEEACYKSSSLAVSLAEKFKTRLHILHISTEKEIALFDNSIPLKDKKITAEVCVHHLWFDRSDYQKLGTLIKWNPSIKEPHHKEALFKALLDDRLDIIATDHAPHTWDEKQSNYWKAPSGGPLVQHSLPAMLEFYHEGKISLEKIVEKMSHSPAICFQIEKRGFIREGYWADLTVVDLKNPWTVSKENIYYKCGWSAFEGKEFKSKVTHTIVSGHLAYSEGKFDNSTMGKRLSFDRD
jgi:dihydroorotase